MHFEPTAVPAELNAAFNRFITIVGWDRWKRRIEWLDRYERSSSTMINYLNARLPLEMAFREMARRRHFQRLPWPAQTLEQHLLYSFIMMTIRVHQRLSKAGRTRLQGMLEDALKNDVGLGPVAYEMKIATQLMGLGFDVFFHDIETGSGFDFLVSKDNIIAEVECKLITGDVGRKIHLRRFHQLGANLQPILEKHTDKALGGILVRVFIPDRLHGTEHLQENLSCLVCDTLESQSGIELPDGSETSVSSFPLEGSPFTKSMSKHVTVGQISAYIERNLSLTNKNVLVKFKPSVSCILVSVESKKPDNVLRGIFKQLKTATRDQFSGNHPAIVCCEFSDLNEQELQELGAMPSGSTGLANMAGAVLRDRPKVHSIAFTTRGSVIRTQTRRSVAVETSSRESGSAWVFENPDHPQAGSTEYTIFA